MPDQTLAQLVRAKYPGAYDKLSDQQLEAAVVAKYPGAYDSVPKTPAPSGSAQPSSALGTAEDVATGFAKGAAHTALDLGSAVDAVPGVKWLIDKAYGQPGISDKAFEAARQATKYRNTAQTVGGVAEGAAELAVPVSAAVEAVPSTARAGAAFKDVMSAAGSVPLDVEAPGKVALRIQQLAERGGSMPLSVRKFLARITDPNKADMTYEEGRDFASNISRLSANEMGRLTPVLQREVANLRVSLNAANATAAQVAGKGAEYAGAMKEYANAMKFKGAVDTGISALVKAGVPLTAAGLGYWLAKHTVGLVTGD